MKNRSVGIIKFVIGLNFFSLTNFLVSGGAVIEYSLTNLCSQLSIKGISKEDADRFGIKIWGTAGELRNRLINLGFKSYIQQNAGDKDIHNLTQTLRKKLNTRTPDKRAIVDYPREYMERLIDLEMLPAPDLSIKQGIPSCLFKILVKKNIITRNANYFFEIKDKKTNTDKERRDAIFYIRQLALCFKKEPLNEFAEKLVRSIGMIMLEEIGIDDAYAYAYQKFMVAYEKLLNQKMIELGGSEDEYKQYLKDLVNFNKQSA